MESPKRAWEPRYALRVELIFRRGLAVFRLGAWLWMTATLVIYWHSDYVRHKGIAVFLIGVALMFTVLQTALVPASIRFVNRRRVALAELAAGMVILALDGFVRRPNIVFETGPTLGSWWPVVGLMSAATYMPLWASGLAGISFGIARVISSALNGEHFSALSGSEQLSLINTGVFAALAAVSVGGLMRLLRNAESEVALARAREEVARNLHDGVLQTLAVVERRTDDAALAALAREQERDLRRYLFGQQSAGGEKELGSGLLETAARFETAFGGRVQVVIAPDLTDISGTSTHALIGAVGEALTNAGKHGRAKSVTIYVEPSDDIGGGGIFCSVKDDGAGFEVDGATPGVGISRSIRGRVQEAGGRVEIKSTPGIGTEVLIWLP